MEVDKIRDKVADWVLELVKESDETLSYKDISDETKLNRHQIADIAEHLEEEGEVKIQDFATAKVMIPK